jgi:trimeric autotransporter adhesin
MSALSIKVRKRLGSGAATAAVALAAVAAATAAVASGVTGITGNDRITAFTRVVQTIGGGFSGDGGPAAKALLHNPGGVAVDRQGNVYIADTRNERIRKVSPGGTITTFAGGGSGISGASGPATSAYFQLPTAVAVDGQGKVYIADSSASFVYRVSPGGILTRFAGMLPAGGVAFGFSGDGGPATSAQLNSPGDVAVDGHGNVYISDTGNNRVREVSASGTIRTIAGTGVAGFSGDRGPATSAKLDQPAGIAVDGHGNVYIADRYNARVRKVTPSGTITTVAGNGQGGVSFATGRATSTPLNDPFSLAVDAHGNLYVSADDRNVFKVSPGGTITPVAGLIRSSPLPKGSGVGGPATSASLVIANAFGGLAFDRQGNLYIAAVGSNAVFKIWNGSSSANPTGKGSKGTPKTAPTTTSRAVHTLAVSFESYLAQMARDRAKLKSVLTSVATCSISPGAAAVQVAAVSAGRQRLLNAVNGFPAPTLQAAQIKAALQQSLTYSAAADRAYHNWLAQQGAHCPAAHTPVFGQAQQQDRLATAAKVRFVAAFNPLARRLHLRTWSANMI